MHGRRERRDSAECIMLYELTVYPAVTGPRADAPTRCKKRKLISEIIIIKWPFYVMCFGVERR